MSAQSMYTVVLRSKHDSELLTFGDEIAIFDAHSTTQVESQCQFFEDNVTQLNAKIGSINTKNNSIDTSINTIMSLQRNDLASCASNTIWPVPAAEGAIPPSVPRTVAMFWELREEINSELASSFPKIALLATADITA